jgi:hypothetical protein
MVFIVLKFVHVKENVNGFVLASGLKYEICGLSAIHWRQ